MKRFFVFVVLFLHVVIVVGLNEGRQVPQEAAGKPKQVVTQAAHGTENLMLRCGDYRFRRHLEKWIDENLGSADEHVWPGCTLCLTDKDLRPKTLEVIRTYQRLHDIKKIQIIGHRDCGGHEGSRKFANADKERDYHHGELRKAHAVLQEHYPTLGVKLYFAEFDKNGQLRLEEVVGAE